MPVNITEEFVRFLMKQNEEQSARIAELSAEITSLNQTIRELKEQLNKNSKNSSKPPLSDGLKKHDCKTQTAPVIIGHNVWSRQYCNKKYSRQCDCCRQSLQSDP